MDRYKILKTLGDGTYGSVVKAINKQIGAVGVFAGLYLVVASEPAATSSRDPVDPAPLLAEKSSSEALGP